MSSSTLVSSRLAALCFVVLCVVANAALGQGSPFQEGAESLVDEVLAIATPIAILLVMGLGIVAATGRISWGWPIGVILGIGVMFSAPRIVGWVQTMFGA